MSGWLTTDCCTASLVVGCLLVILGVVALLAGRGLITAAILRTMALTPDRWAVAVCDGAGGPSSSLIIRIDIAMQLSCNTVSQ